MNSPFFLLSMLTLTCAKLHAQCFNILVNEFVDIKSRTAFVTGIVLSVGTADNMKIVPVKAQCDAVIWNHTDVDIGEFNDEYTLRLTGSFRPDETFEAFEVNEKCLWLLKIDDQGKKKVLRRFRDKGTPHYKGILSSSYLLRDYSKLEDNQKVTYIMSKVQTDDYMQSHIFAHLGLKVYPNDTIGKYLDKNSFSKSSFVSKIAFQEACTCYMWSLWYDSAQQKMVLEACVEDAKDNKTGLLLYRHLSFYSQSRKWGIPRSDSIKLLSKLISKNVLDTKEHNDAKQLLKMLQEK